jgi:hypothetical protein
MDEATDGHPATPRRPGRWTSGQIEAIRARAAELGYFTPTALARAVGVSHATVLRWYSGAKGASMETQQRLADVLAWPWPTDFLGPPGSPGEDGVSSGDGERYTPTRAGVTSVRGGGRRDVPVYRAGTRADPWSVPDARALVEGMVALLEAEARALGERGFGLRVTDESLSRWDVHRDDVLWFDPDWPVEPVVAAAEDAGGGVLVAALLPCGELAARVLRRGELVTDGADQAEAVPFAPELYRGRNVSRMRPMDRPRRLPDAPRP